MSYTLLNITDVLLKSDKTLYKLGTAAYDDMFAEQSETLDYERDIIFLYSIISVLSLTSIWVDQFPLLAYSNGRALFSFQFPSISSALKQLL